MDDPTTEPGSDTWVYHPVELHVMAEQASGEWEVRWKGRAVASFDRKHDAIEDGRARAIGPLPAELVIHAADGRIESRQPYP